MAPVSLLQFGTGVPITHQLDILASSVPCSNTGLHRRRVLE
jgi:hypothetical protein